MLAHDALGAGTLAAHQGVEHRVVLQVGEIEATVLAVEILGIHRQGAHRGEGQVLVTPQGHGDGRITAGRDDGLVKGPIET